MPVYREDTEKLNFTVQDNNKPVKIEVSCMNNGVVDVSFNYPMRNIDCQDGPEEIGYYEDLHKEIKYFFCSVQNPEQKEISIQHKIFQEGGDTLIYNFPKDYTGEPAYNPRQESAEYEFLIKFR